MIKCTTKVQCHKLHAMAVRTLGVEMRTYKKKNLLLIILVRRNYVCVMQYRVYVVGASENIEVKRLLCKTAYRMV